LWRLEEQDPGLAAFGPSLCCGRAKNAYFLTMDADDFEGLTGLAFRPRGGGPALTLTRVMRAGEAAFTLIFSAPPGLVLPEGFYEFETERGDFAFHVMPIHTLAPGRQDYQAVFN